MPFSLITSTGKVYTFYVKSVAELYQQIHGGVVITNQIVTQLADVSDSYVS
jgi:hypothetical protein